jgi:hypothetical protein
MKSSLVCFLPSLFCTVGAEELSQCRKPLPVAVALRAGIRVGSVSRFGFRENSTLLVILRSAVEVKNAMPMAVLLN